jgi:hypothetical protein
MPTENPHIQRVLGRQLAAALADYTWPVEAIPTIPAMYRRWVDFDRNDFAGLQVSVSPGVNQWGGDTGMQDAPRGADALAVALNIQIGKIVPAGDGREEEIEALEDLSMAIQDAIRSRLITLPPGVDFMSLAEAPDERELGERDLFMTNIGVVFGMYVDHVA